MHSSKLHCFVATAAFGLEGIAAGELRRMGIPAKAEQGGARFECTPADAFRANLWLRSADRVLMVLAEGVVQSFEDLYRLVLSISWESFLPVDASILVSGKCVRSQLMSVRDCQAISKKAICTRLSAHYRTDRLPETGAAYPVDISIHRDKARITLDMSGDALNRRGYRTWNGEAPLRETLAAALVDSSPWRVGMPLYDPCCGTGTLMIEAAMKATRRAPGLTRSFACEKYSFMPQADMQAFRRDAQDAYMQNAPLAIGGSDIDPTAVQLCEKHVQQAGYEACIQPSVQDFRTLTLQGPPGVFLTNPPYGERLSDQKNCRDLYRALGALLTRHPGWQMGVIASDPAFERSFGRRATHKRRLYNGRLECEFFIFQKK